SRQWEQACDYLDDDLDSGYVRVLQEMMAAGWSDPEIAVAVRGHLDGWFSLLRSVAATAMCGIGTAAVLESEHLGALVGAAFVGAETLMLLGFRDDPMRTALRSVGELIARMEGQG